MSHGNGGKVIVFRRTSEGGMRQRISGGEQYYREAKSSVEAMGKKVGFHHVLGYLARLFGLALTCSAEELCKIYLNIPSGLKWQMMLWVVMG